ncbi:MAG: class I SAM-dependent methyltransferase [Promethearchaeota archaeon]|nr:MAG: class I SAM-dependent methyltransferase [Candidatus Lokiarchaeota archaeon]
MPKTYVQSDEWKSQTQSILPYLATPFEVIQDIFAFLVTKTPLAGKSLVDLGAGDGRVIFYGAEHHDMNTTGVEINQEFLEGMRTTVATRGLQDRVLVVEADLFNFNLEPFDFVFCYLTPACNRVLEHLIKQIKPHALVISIRWPLTPFEQYWHQIYELRFLTDMKVWIYEKSD